VIPPPLPKSHSPLSAALRLLLLQVLLLLLLLLPWWPLKRPVDGEAVVPISPRSALEVMTIMRTTTSVCLIEFSILIVLLSIIFLQRRRHQRSLASTKLRVLMFIKTKASD